MRLDGQKHRTRIIFALAITGLICASIVIYWLVRLNSPDSMDVPASLAPEQTTTTITTSDPSDDPDTFMDTVSGADSTKPAFVSKEDLLKVCDIPSWPREYESWEFFNELKSLVSTECKEAFDVYLRTHNFGKKGVFQLISLENPMSFHRVFLDPVRDRELVFDALSKEECRFEDSATLEWEMKEVCHASAFANHMQFLRFCRPDLSPPVASLFDDLQRLERVKNDQTNPLNAHLKIDIEGMANDLWIRYLERSRIYTECEKYSDDVRSIAIYEDQNTQEYQWLHGVATRLGEHARWGDGTSSPVLNLLHSFAARFGDEWAMTTYMPSQLTRDEWWSKMHEHNPWDDLWKTFIEHKETGLPRMKDGIELVLSLQDSNIEFDWKWLVMHLCSQREENMPSVPESNCQSILVQLYEEVDDFDSRRLRVLDRIEVLALELQVYH